MATEVSQVPNLGKLESVQKAMAIPTVGAAVEQVGALYFRVKGAHSLLDWALSTAEAGVALAASTAVPYVASPLAHADTKVAAAIDELERRVPILTEKPRVIIDTTKQAMMDRVTPHVNKVCGARSVAGQRVKSLKELSWTKANALLSTAYGQKALESVDSGAMYAMKLLDHYLPAQQKEEETSVEIVPAQSDPALHTVQTVGRLSAVAARRVWANLAARVYKLKQAGIQLDPRRYVAALLAALHLADVTRQQQQQDQQQQEQQKQQSEQEQEKPNEKEGTKTSASPSAGEQPLPSETTPPKSTDTKKVEI